MPEFHFDFWSYVLGACVNAVLMTASFMFLQD